MMGKNCDCKIVGWKQENGKRVPIYKKKDKNEKNDKKSEAK